MSRLPGEPPDIEQRRRTRSSDKPGHYAVVWVDGPSSDEAPPLAKVVKVCRECGDDNNPMLHADPRNSHPQRTICGKCQGEINRERTGRSAP